MTWRLVQVCWRYLLFGSDDLVLPKTWLLDKSRIGNYVGYTRRQREQGSVVKNVAEKRREAFWEAVEAKAQQPKKLKVVSGRFQ